MTVGAASGDTAGTLSSAVAGLQMVTATGELIDVKAA